MLAAMESTRTCIVVPTYQEYDALPSFVTAFGRAAPELDCLIVDDASPDGTGRLADALAAWHPWLRVLHRPAKDGLGNAYRAGLGWALDHGYARIGQMDADLSHPPDALDDL